MAAAALLAALLCAPVSGEQSRRPARTEVVVETDARVELLGVLQLLSRDPLRARELPAAESDVEARFAPWRGHAAVKSYAALSADPRRRVRLLSLLFHLSPPPELSPRPGTPPIPQEDVEAVGGAAAEREILAQWRDFYKVSDFSSYLAERAAADERAAAVFRSALAPDAAARVENYVGPLDARVHAILSPVLRAGGFSTIIPYPFAGGGVRVSGPFEVYEVLEPARLEKGAPFYAAGALWSEPLDVAVDPLLGERCAEVAALAGARAPLARECPDEWFHCATNIIKAAVLRRLDAQVPGAFGGGPAPDGAYGDALRAFDRALEDYERRRADVPTLRDFYPRLVATLASLPRGPAPSAEEAARMCGPGRASPAGPAAPPDAAPRSAEEFKRDGVWRLLHGDAPEALADFRRAARLDPNDAEPRLDASVALSRLGRAAEASAEADAAVALARRAELTELLADALSNRATLRAQSGDAAGARADLSAALAAAPADWPRRGETAKRLADLTQTQVH